jgi:acyl-CoA thioesterase-1
MHLISLIQSWFKPIQPRWTLLLTAGVTSLLMGCGGGSATSTSGEPSPLAIVQPETPVVILVFGDSLSSGWGMAAGNDWASLLQQKIKSTGLDAKAPVTVVNESVAGEFALGAVTRLPEVLARVRPTHVLLAHGTNDARTSYPWNVIADALGDMAEQTKQAGATPLLLDITLTAYGPEVAAAYTATFKETAIRHAISYVGVVHNLVFKPEYYDPVMMENVWNALLPTLK